MSAPKIDSALHNGNALPFDERQQLACLGYLLFDEQFFYLCKQRLKPEWFLDAHSARIWKTRLAFQENHKRTPKSIEEFRSDPEFTSEDNQVRNRLYQQIIASKNEMQFHGRDVLESRLQDWLQAQLLRDTFTQASALYQKGDLQASLARAKTGVREIEAVKFSPDEVYDNDMWQTHFAESTKELENACTFGVDLVDKLLNPSAISGSLLRGDTTVLLAPQNIGKTTTMITVARHNIMLDKDVLFMVHEGRPRDIMEKLWCSMLQVNKRQLLDGVGDEEWHAYYEMVAAKLKERLTFIPLIKAGQTIEDVDAILRNKVAEKIARTGKGFDMIVDDYAAILSTTKANKGGWAKRQVDDEVYKYVVAWAGEFDTHCLTAIQANREGAKINAGIRGNKGESLRLLVPTDVSESFGPCQTASNVITINRDERGKREGWIVYLLAKSRSSETDIAVICKSDFGRGTTHSNDLGATWYRGISTMSERVNDYLRRYKGIAISEHELLFNKE